MYEHLNAAQERILRNVVRAHAPFGMSSTRGSYSPTKAREHPTLRKLEELGFIQRQFAGRTKDDKGRWRVNRAYISTPSGEAWVREADRWDALAKPKL